MDNVFAIAMIFTAFGVAGARISTVFFTGASPARLLMRGLMIGVGAALLQSFHWVSLLMGAFLVLTGIQWAFSRQELVRPENNLVVRLARKFFPVSPGFEGDRFLTRIGGRRALTPLALVLLAVETTDLLFAVDSIPAIFAVTQNAFIVFTSNIFAILGLRSLYFVLAGAMRSFPLFAIRPGGHFGVYRPENAARALASGSHGRFAGGGPGDPRAIHRLFHPGRPLRQTRGEKQNRVMNISRRVFPASMWCILFAVLSGMAAAQEINPYPREVIKTEKVIEWTFQANAAGWTAAHDCALAAAGGVLRIQSSGDDPYLFGPPIQIDGPVTARLRLKCAAGGNGQIFWATATAPDFNEAHSQHFHLIHDNQWHDYTVALAEDGTIRAVAFGPGRSPRRDRG